MAWRAAWRTSVAVLSGTACAGLAALWPIGYRRPAATIAFGPGGRAVAVAAAGGTVHARVADVPTGPLVAWSVDVRRMSADALQEGGDQLVLAADHRLGDTLVPPPPRALGPTPPVAHAPFGLSAGGGRNVFGTTGTWFAYASAPAWAVVPALAILTVRAVGR